MSDVGISTTVTLKGYSEPLDREAALDVLQYIDAYDPPAAYSNRLSNVEGLDPDMLSGAQVLWGDHVPDAFDVAQERPHIFYATYDDRDEGRVLVSLRTTREALADFDHALQHVFEAVKLEPEPLEAVVATDLDVEFDDFDAPASFLLSNAHHPDRTNAFSITPMDRRFEGSPDDASLDDSMEAIHDELDDSSQLDGTTTTFSLSELLEPGIQNLVEQFETIQKKQTEAENLAERLASVDAPLAEVEAVDAATVTFEGHTRPLSEAEAIELLQHIDAHDPPEAYAAHTSGVADPEDTSILDAIPMVSGEDVTEARVVWADHEPDVADTSELEPTVFVASYEDERVHVFSRASVDALSAVDGALAHFYEREPLHVETLKAEVSTDRSVDIEDVDVPGPGFSLSQRDSFEQSTINLGTMPDLREDRTTTFSVTDVLEPELRAVGDEIESLVGRLESVEVTGTGETAALGPEAAAEILQHVAAYEPPEALSEVTATADTIDADTAAEVTLAWGDHVPDVPVDDLDRYYLGYDAEPTLFYAGYDENGQERVSVSFVASLDTLSVADEFLEHVFEVTELEPETLEGTFVAGDDSEFEADDVQPPDGFTATFFGGDVTVSPDDDLLLDDTATALSVGGDFGPALLEVIAQIETLSADADDTGTDVF